MVQVYRYDPGVHAGKADLFDIAAIVTAGVTAIVLLVQALATLR